MAVSRAAVRKKAHSLITESWQSQANLSLFLALEILIIFVLPSLGFGRADIKIYSDVSFSILLISGLAIAWRQRILFCVTAVLAIGAIVMRWLTWHNPTPRLELWNDSWAMAAIVALIIVLLRQIFLPGRVTHMRIQGAIAVYILFGAAWAHAYHLASVTIPGSFNGPVAELATVSGWTYYSFVTLTTVGYGDITPVSQVARTMSIGEALTGQLYLAVLIARLVAMEIVFWQQKIAND